MQRVSVIRSSFFWKLYLTFSFVVLVITASIATVVSLKMQDYLMAGLVSASQSHVALIAPFAESVLSEGYKEESQKHAEQIANEAKIRITLIREGGEVIVDTERNPHGLDNHWHRPEVEEALKNQVGTVIRMSDSVKEPMMYTAHAIRNKQGDVLGVARIALPTAAIQDRILQMRFMILAVALVGICVALFVGLLIARRAAKPIAEMKQVAEAMRQGVYEKVVNKLPADEIGVLGDTLNRLGDELTQRSETISTDKAQLKAMLTGMVEGIIAVDEEDRILFANQAAAHFFDWSNGSREGQKLYKMTGISPISEIVEEARKQKNVTSTEISISKGRDKFILEARANIFALKGKEIGVIVVLHDVTSLRRLERIRRDFVANVSHELKTPLTSIKGYVETLLSGALHDQDNNVRFLDKINDNVSRLVLLVQDLLSLAKIETQESSMNLAPVDWLPVISSVVGRHEDDMAKKSITLSIEGADAPFIVLGEKDAMIHVLENLVDNAIKYTPQGGKLKIQLHIGREQGSISVADTGFGIPQKDLNRIFERFYRVDKARSRVLGGTGLGLSIVKHLVQAMKGEVTVKSEEGKGSEFTVTLGLPH